MSEVPLPGLLPYRSDWRFAELLNWHLLRGTRPNGSVNPDTLGEQWKNKDFAVAVGGYGDRPTRNLENWRNGENEPNDLAPIEKAFFGTRLENFKAWRFDLRKAWKIAKARRRAERSNDSTTTIQIAEDRFVLKSSSEIVQSPPRKPSLEWLSLSDAFEEREPNLFSVMRWDYRLVKTLYGRDDNLRKTLAWAENDSKAPSARLITGEGGAGKTRLAATAADLLREKGWTVGFLPRGDALIEVTVKAKGLFLILDYPEEQPERATALLRELADRKTAPYPLRVLFLSRRSFVEWEREATILQGRFGWQEIAAAQPLSTDDGERLIEEAARNFVAHTKNAMPDLRDAKVWLEASSIHRLPLYAMAAAIHAVLSPKEAFGLAGEEILKSLAFREIGRVDNVSIALGLGQEVLARLLALGVLADGLSEDAITELAEIGACGNSTSNIVEGVSRSPWWKEGRLIRLEPDLLAAAFLALVLFDERFPKGRDDLPEWLFVALLENAATFGNRLGRVLYDSHRLDRVREGLHPLDGRLAQMIVDEPWRATAFARVANRDVPFLAAKFAALVAESLADRANEPGIRACYLNNAAVDLSVVGRREEALAAGQEAVNIRRDLARASSETFTSDLATSLNNLANFLSELGRLEEALAAGQEAEKLYRDLARARPEAFTPNLAVSLNNLASILSALGRHEEALAARQEAAKLSIKKKK